MLLAATTRMTAQEQLFPLNSNPILYQQAKSYIPETTNSRGAWMENYYYIIANDTLQLPFVDDFSTNKTRPFRYEKNFVSDTVFNSYGPCDSVLGVPLIISRFHTVPTYTVSYDTLNKKYDTLFNSPITLNKYSATDEYCLLKTATPFVVYPEQFSYTFDTVSGRQLTKTPVNDDLVFPDTIIEYVSQIYRVYLPANILWVDNYAYINQTFPILPPSIGVATFDGLNQYGLPYNNSQIAAWGVADYLTSKPLNLGGLANTDSVYLSFFYQPQGLGDWPNSIDSLQVEFFNFQTSKWDVVWSTPGFATPPNPVPAFKQVFIEIPYSFVPTYRYNGFRFRFKNYATLTGNNDHWHVDYVRLDKNRTLADTTINDIAFSYPYPNVLKNYEVITAKEMDNTELSDTISFAIVNNNTPQAINNPPATEFTNNNQQFSPSSVPLANSFSVFNAGLITTPEIYPATSFATIAAGDSIVIANKAYIGVSNTNTTNDTIENKLICNNILAYDDGSAEWGYGLNNIGTKMFGYEFNLKNTDTLYGFQILYSHIDEKVDDLVFTFNLWDSIVINNPTYVANPVFSSPIKKPYYIDSINGFTTYKLDTPIALPKKFYFGWSQTDERNLQIGFDRNSKKGVPHMYYFANGVWNKSTLKTGSPMIRLILGHYYGTTSGIAEAEKMNITIYPNPAQNKLFIQSDKNSNVLHTAVVYSITGQQLYNENLTDSSIDIAALPEGMYILQIKDKNESNVYATKFVKIGSK